MWIKTPNCRRLGGLGQALICPRLLLAGDEGGGVAGLSSQAWSWLFRVRCGWWAFLVGFLHLVSAGEEELEEGNGMAWSVA